MPTENEIKFLLKLDCEKFFENFPKIEIQQGYLYFDENFSLRIRKSVQTTFRTKITKHTQTYKKLVNNRIIEIETEIESRDFDDLSTVAFNKLDKIRYQFQQWEVDAFKENGKTYIIVAECEMPEGQLFPENIPDLIKDNTIFLVPKHDNRFASGRLADSKYSKSLYSCFNAWHEMAGVQ